MRVRLIHAKGLWRAAAAASASTVVLVSVLTLAGAPAALTPAGATSGVAKCTTSELVVWLNTRGNGTAGSMYYDLQFTNLSAHSCTLEGYPGLSGVNLAGRQLGSAAARDSTPSPRLITLTSATSAMGLGVSSSSNTATAVVQLTDVGNLASSSCAHATAAGIRVYPPDQTASKVVPFPFVACSHAGPIYLHVKSIQKGIMSD
jgi:hypothetical protein